MSVNTLENIKEQTEKLTTQEKRQLADYLFETSEKTDATNLGLSSACDGEKRHKIDKWMKENSEKYGGLYVALDGDKLLGTGKNYPEAAQWAKKAGVIDAFIDFVRPIGYVGEMGGWD